MKRTFSYKQNQAVRFGSRVLISANEDSDWGLWVLHGKLLDGMKCLRWGLMGWIEGMMSWGGCNGF